MEVGGREALEASRRPLTWQGGNGRAAGSAPDLEAGSESGGRARTSLRSSPAGSVEGEAQDGHCSETALLSAPTSPKEAAAGGKPSSMLYTPGRTGDGADRHGRQGGTSAVSSSSTKAPRSYDRSRSATGTVGPLASASSPAATPGGGLRFQHSATLDVGTRRRGGAGLNAARGHVTQPLPRTSSQQAWKSLRRSISCDGVCFAVCVAGGFDLQALGASLGTEAQEAVQAPDSRANDPEAMAVAATVRAAPRVPPLFGAASAAAKQSNGAAVSLADAEFVQMFGTGENCVLQLKVFRGKDLFAFSFGCLVCWSFDNSQILEVKELFRPFMVRKYEVANEDEDSMEFASKRWDDNHADEDYDEEADGNDASKNGAVRHDQIILQTTSPLEKLAHSYALAQSVRLGVFEIAVDRSIAETRNVPETMARTGEVKLDANQLSMRMGGLLMLRCDVNLHTDILDTPEIFWDEERFEPNYDACRVYLDIDKRVEILNQRLGVLKDLYDLLQNSLNVKHGNKLEWIIIILILVEVLLELLEFLHDAGH